MSIFLYEKDNSLNNFSTKDYNTNKINNIFSTSSEYASNNQLQNSNSSRSIFNQKRKAFNMEDNQSRIKREYSYLYMKSQKEKNLFEKGVKKVQISNLKQNRQSNSFSGIKRSDKNKTKSYNILVPSGDAKNKKQGLKKVNLNESLSNAAGSKTQRNNETSKKKLYSDRFNNETYNSQKNKENYVVSIIPGHKNSNAVWMNKQIHLHFNKKNNINSIEHSQQRKNFADNTKKHFGDVNKSSFKNEQNGIISKQNKQKNNKKQVDFNQNYYKKVVRIPEKQRSYLKASKY